MGSRSAERSLAAALLAVTACSSSPSIPFAQYAQRRLEAQCQRLVSCGVFASAAACPAYFRLIPDSSLAAAVHDHKVRYDGVAAAACVDALAKQSCDATSRDARVAPAPCGKVLTGELGGGAPCAFSTECKSGSCMFGSACDPSTCCAGTCADTSPSPIGGACHVDSDCVADTYCGLDQLCHALGKDGATCYGDNQCDYGLACITATNPGICHALGADAGPCPYGRCASVGDTCNASMTCVAVGLPGAACTMDAQCSPYGRCDTASGQCAAAPDIGQPCTSQCEADAWCDSMTATCQALLTDTTPCNTDLECASYLCKEGPVFDACAERPVCD